MIFTFSVRFYDPTIVGCPSEHQGEWQFVLILGFRLPVGAWNELISVREEPNDESWNNVTPHRYHLFFQQRGKCILLLSVHRWLRNCTYPLLLNNLMCYSCCDQMDGRYKERTKRQRGVRWAVGVQWPRPSYYQGPPKPFWLIEEKKCHPAPLVHCVWRPQIYSTRWPRVPRFPNT